MDSWIGSELCCRLEIVQSWFALVDDDGWIAREQILGAEARSKVPAEFQVQYPHYANPPTLFLTLQAFVDRLKASNGTANSGREVFGSNDVSGTYAAHLDNAEVALQYLKRLYPLLKRHYFWFRKTQWGDIRSYDRQAFSTKEAYRWRGRTPRHILPSGLDDYPRPQPPHPGELHLDLISWMGMMSRSIKDVAEVIGEKDDVAEFAGYELAITRNIDDLHWSDAHRTYCDATIDDYEENVHACHKGYVSIFPFMLGLLPPDSRRLEPILDLIEDPEELWSDYGIRSLSKKDGVYGTDENYWRSPIWINMNYLIIQQLLVSTATNFPFLDSPALTHCCVRDLYSSNQLPAIRPSPKPKARIKSERETCTLGCASTLSKTSTANGTAPASPGSSTTRKPAPANARSISPAGPRSSSRL